MTIPPLAGGKLCRYKNYASEHAVKNEKSEKTAVSLHRIRIQLCWRRCKNQRENSCGKSNACLALFLWGRHPLLPAKPIRLQLSEITAIRDTTLEDSHEEPRLYPKKSQGWIWRVNMANFDFGEPWVEKIKQQLYLSIYKNSQIFKPFSPPGETFRAKRCGRGNGTALKLPFDSRCRLYVLVDKL